MRMAYLDGVALVTAICTCVSADADIGQAIGDLEEMSTLPEAAEPIRGFRLKWIVSRLTIVSARWQKLPEKAAEPA